MHLFILKNQFNGNTDVVKIVMVICEWMKSWFPKYIFKSIYCIGLFFLTWIFSPKSFTY